MENQICLYKLKFPSRQLPLNKWICKAFKVDKDTNNIPDQVISFPVQQDDFGVVRVGVDNGFMW